MIDVAAFGPDLAPAGGDDREPSTPGAGGHRDASPVIALTVNSPADIYEVMRYGFPGYRRALALYPNAALAFS
jgi:hypothetical protein